MKLNAQMKVVVGLALVALACGLSCNPVVEFQPDSPLLRVSCEELDLYALLKHSRPLQPDGAVYEGVVMFRGVEGHALVFSQKGTLIGDMVVGNSTFVLHRNEAEATLKQVEHGKGKRDAQEAEAVTSVSVVSSTCTSANIRVAVDAALAANSGYWVALFKGSQCSVTANYVTGSYLPAVTVPPGTTDISSFGGTLDFANTNYMACVYSQPGILTTKMVASVAMSRVCGPPVVFTWSMTFAEGAEGVDGADPVAPQLVDSLTSAPTTWPGNFLSMTAGTPPTSASLSPDTTANVPAGIYLLTISATSVSTVYVQATLTDLSTTPSTVGPVSLTSSAMGTTTMFVSGSISLPSGGKFQFEAAEGPMIDPTDFLSFNKPTTIVFTLTRVK